MCHNLILRFISLVYPPILMTDILSQDISYFQQFYIYLFFIDWLFIVVQVYLSPFSCHHFPPPHPPPPPTLNSTSLWLCPWVLYTCSLMTLPPLSPIIPFPSPLWLLSICSLFQCLWMYFACLFCWLHSTYRSDHIVFVFHHLAYFT